MNESIKYKLKEVKYHLEQEDTKTAKNMLRSVFFDLRPTDKEMEEFDGVGRFDELDELDELTS